MESKYELTRDPLFYLTLGFFALLSTAIPALLAMPRLLGILPALILTGFLAIPLRRHQWQATIWVVGVWLVLHILFLAAVSALLPGQVERAIPDGFAFRRGLIQWFYTAQDLPGSQLAAPMSQLGQVVGLFAGSLISGGLIGAWFTVKVANLTAFGIGSLFADGGGLASALAGLGPWVVLQLAGYAGLLVLGAIPLWSGRWSPLSLWREQRRLALVSIALIIGSYIVEITLAGSWASWLNP